MNYNKSFNWIGDLRGNVNRVTTEVTFDPHALDRVEYYNLDLDKVEETVRTGKIKFEKCKEPKKVCFERYFGKENLTYCVITIFHQDFIEVKTIWPRKGR